MLKMAASFETIKVILRPTTCVKNVFKLTRVIGPYRLTHSHTHSTNGHMIYFVFVK